MIVKATICVANGCISKLLLYDGTNLRWHPIMLLFDCLEGLVGFFKCFTQTIYSDKNYMF